MGCCGKKHRGKVPVSAVMRARVKRALTPKPRTAAPATEGRSKGLCVRVADKGDLLEVEIRRGMIVVEVEGRYFELFSALRAQGCPDAYASFASQWKGLTQRQRSGLSVTHPTTIRGIRAAIRNL